MQLTLTLKRYALLHAQHHSLTSSKFQPDWMKTVGGVIRKHKERGGTEGWMYR